MVLLCQYGGWKGFACDSFQTTFLWILWTTCGSIVGTSISDDYAWFVIGRFVFEHEDDKFDCLALFRRVVFWGNGSIPGWYLNKQHSHLQEGSHWWILLDDGDTDEEDHWRGQINDYQWFNPLRRWNISLFNDLQIQGAPKRMVSVIRWTTLILFNPCETSIRW